MRLHSILLLLSILLANELNAQSFCKVTPHYLTTQYAGSIGYFSYGIGYKLDTKSMLSVHYGHVPSSKGGKLDILALKYSYSPLSLNPSAKLVVQPINIGFMGSYHHGSNFHTRWPSRYPEGYYWWIPSLKFHMITETAITFNLTNGIFKSISGYIEFNSNGLYVISYVLNANSLRLTDIIKTGIGVRVKLK